MKKVNIVDKTSCVHKIQNAVNSPHLVVSIPLEVHHSLQPTPELPQGASNFEQSTPPSKLWAILQVMGVFEVSGHNVVLIFHIDLFLVYLDHLRCQSGLSTQFDLRRFSGDGDSVQEFD